MKKNNMADSEIFSLYELDNRFIPVSQSITEKGSTIYGTLAKWGETVSESGSYGLNLDLARAFGTKKEAIEEAQKKWGSEIKIDTLKLDRQYFLVQDAAGPVAVKEALVHESKPVFQTIKPLQQGSLGGQDTPYALAAIESNLEKGVYSQKPCGYAEYKGLLNGQTASEEKSNLFMSVTPLSRSNITSMKNYFDQADQNSKELFSEISGPANFQGRAQVWEALEKLETRPDALLGRKFEASLPANLDIEQKKEICRAFIGKHITSKNLIADWSIRENPQGQSYFSMLVPGREVNENGFGDKTRLFTKKTLSEMNHSWGQSTEKGHGLSLEKTESTIEKDKAFKDMATFAHIEWKMAAIASSSLSQDEKRKLLEPLKKEYLKASEELTQSGPSLGITPNLIEARQNLNLDFTNEMVEKNINLQTVQKPDGVDPKGAQKALADNQAKEYALFQAAQAVEDNPSVENRQKYVDAANDYTESTKNLMEKGESIGLSPKLINERYAKNMEEMSKADHLQKNHNPSAIQTLAALTIMLAQQVKKLLEMLIKKIPTPKPADTEAPKVKAKMK